MYPNIFDEQIKRGIKNINSNCNGNNTDWNNCKHIELFFRDQMYKHYNIDIIVLKNLIHWWRPVIF